MRVSHPTLSGHPRVLTLTHVCLRPAANFVDGMFASTPGGWRYMFGFASIIASLQLLCMSFMPRSPRWLLLQGRRDEAHASLVQIYGGSERRENNASMLSFQISR
jgi:hypothetical protein